METKQAKEPSPMNEKAHEIVADNLQLRSDEVQEFIGNKPHLIIRWGITVFFLVLTGLGIVCWFIQYPDLVTARAKLNSINAPKEVITRTDGKLQQILVKEGDSIVAGTTLAYIESIADPTAIVNLKNQVDSIILLTHQNKTDEIIRFFPDYTSQDFLNRFGELQQPFQTFMQSFITYRDFICSGFYLHKKEMLQTDIKNIYRSHGVLLQQKELLQRDLQLTDETFIANASLATDKVISAMEYRTEKSKLIAKQLSLPQVTNSIISNEGQQNDKRKEIAELENQMMVQKNNFIQALQTFNSNIAQWEHKYALKAPVSGRVSCVGFVEKDQLVKSGQLLFYVQPGNTGFFAEILIPQYNFGKIRPGQTVLLKFQAYPYEQFGSVAGKVDFISSTPVDSGFWARVALPDGLKTSYHKQLPYQYGLIAQADIMTENMNLVQRIYYNMRKQMDR